MDHVGSGGVNRTGPLLTRSDLPTTQPLPRTGRPVLLGMHEDAGALVPTEVPAPPTTSIVVADAHAAFAHAFASVASSNGHGLEVCGVATDGPSTRDLVLEAQPDVLLVDVQLPAEGARPVIRELAEQAPDVKVILVYPVLGAAAAAGELASGVRGVLSKTAMPHEIITAIRSVAAGDVVLAPEAARALVENRNDLLTPSDIALLERFVTGGGRGEIARELLMSESTVKRKFAEVQRKLGARNRVDAVARAARMGLI